MRSEFKFIEKLRRRKQSPSTTIGIGDDCAVITKDSKTDLVLTADLLVEDIDFRREWTPPKFLGHKALAISLSDVAAMGATPVWAMLSIGVPEKIWKTDFADKFYEGWFALAKKYGVELIGGDVSRTPDKIVVDSIAAGEVKKNKAILRSGAKPNDLIFVSGNLGGAAAGLRLLESGSRHEKTSKNPAQKLILRQLKPNPRAEIGRVLSEKNLATSMIDLSDGLSSDLSHLCRESKVGARIFADKIPLDDNLKKVSSSEGDNTKDFSASLSQAQSLALHGGEDFELLFTVNPKNIFRLGKELKKGDLYQVGVVTANTEIIELADETGTARLTPKGFRHF